MKKEKPPQPQHPLVLRFHRLMDAFAKSDDERDFYLDKVEGFLVFVDLDKSVEELTLLEEELQNNQKRYSLIPKMTFYETKKFMEGFVNEKVYDIDTKEKLLDIISSKEARENFLEFIYDHLTELEKWQQYYHERSRIRIIEWLIGEGVSFVFEEDLDLGIHLLEKLRARLFDAKVPKEIQNARTVISEKAKTYYLTEALNPRPKRGRPPKQSNKVEFEPQYTSDVCLTVPLAMRPFLFNPDITSSSVTFSAKFDNEAQLLSSLRGSSRVKINSKLEVLSQRLESLRHLSDKLKASGLGIDEEERIIQAVSREVDEKEGKVRVIAQDLLPKKKRPVKESASKEGSPKKRAKKQVTLLPSPGKKGNNKT